MEQVIRLSVGEAQENCYILSAEGVCAVIDPGDALEQICDALDRAQTVPAVILLTHGHFDHIGAAHGLREAFGCPIVVGEADAPLLLDPLKSQAGRHDGERFCFTPDRCVREGETVEAGVLSFQVLDTPGHTPGGVCYLCGDCLFCGDTLFDGGWGRTDFYGGDLNALRISLQKLAHLSGATRVYPGHGASTDIAAQLRVNPALGMVCDDDLY